MADQRGFTLIEVLVAVIVTSLLLLTVYGVFTTVDGARQRVEGDAERFHQARVIFDRIGRELHGVYWSASNLQTRFQGGLNQAGLSYLELSTTTATPQSGGGGIVVVRYEMQPDPDHVGTFMLLRSERQLFTEAFGATDTLRMAGGIESFNLRFFARGAWHDNWDAASGGLPALVELTLNEASPAGSVPFISSFAVTAL
ncbi:type II secretion system protein GspJ [Desulfuromonas carbonis]|uniref:prepilin-type N-terminal cleavage/methylation domain-containing protein n=1 Tax=Desulfuromonas sp. DDH964 TaxID=1823759 RepID=UPI00078D2B0E|nr:prepilin-type N-terminal cleavage/methylation domain-containing protein [Desulfuromonas sp. DDH964]AMV71369.1 type II secretion system minor pseudopilin GspJ [Desulfuromonas sp. DDH964]